MFTGIIEEKGTIKYIRLLGNSGVIAVKASRVLEGTQIGDSIAVNGICLTVISLQPDGFMADVMLETMRKSCLGTCRTGTKVNLERAMPIMGRFGGHMVLGHVDGVGRIESIRKEENSVCITIKASSDLLRLIVKKGSICIDGISLTVARVTEQNFEVSIIPHTLEETILIDKRVGDFVNLENDIVGKYVDKLLSLPQLKEDIESNITMEFLKGHDF